MTWLSLCTAPTRLEFWLSCLGALAGFATLAIALWGLFRGQSHAAGRETGVAHRYLRWPYLLIATILYVAVCILLWRPLPLVLSSPVRLIALILGVLLYFPALALYLWGIWTLGEMFDASSGFGVRLRAGHRLITSGPYAFVRHPMYQAVIIVGFGALLIYRTWAVAFFATNMFGLVIRARREEQALAAEFPAEWEAYSRRVPAWLPRIRRK